MAVEPELRSTVFGDSKENVLPSNDSDRVVQVREYQLLLLQKAVHENVRDHMLLYRCVKKTFCDSLQAPVSQRARMQAACTPAHASRALQKNAVQSLCSASTLHCAGAA